MSSAGRSRPVAADPRDTRAASFVGLEAPLLEENAEPDAARRCWAVRYITAVSKSILSCSGFTIALHQSIAENALGDQLGK
jgi:hypothetical protein